MHYIFPFKNEVNKTNSTKVFEKQPLEQCNQQVVCGLFLKVLTYKEI